MKVNMQTEETFSLKNSSDKEIILLNYHMINIDKIYIM